MRARYKILCVVAVLSPTFSSRAMAQQDLSWCSKEAGKHSQVIVCEDFDRYCSNPPAWPTVCLNPTPPPPYQNPSQAPFLLTWPEVGNSGNPMKPGLDYKADGVTPLYADSYPYTGQFYSGSNNSGNQYLDTQHRRDLGPLIEAIQADKNIVNGTDANPLVLKYAFNFHEIGQGRDFYQSHYLDLSLNDGTTIDRAPTDYVKSEDCSAEVGCGSFPGYPIICQQNDSTASSVWGCPPLSSLPVHASIAVGILSWLDTNPCHCGDSVAHAASNWHMAFFDGKEWWTLKHGVPGIDCGSSVTPVGSSPMPPPSEIKSPGDFGLSANMNYITLTIKTSTMQVELDYVDKIDNTTKYQVHHCMTINRQYLGGFNIIAMGVGKGCELDADGNCIGNRHLLGPNGKGGSGDMDSLELYDGVLDSYTSVGACCANDGTCVEADQITCANVLHGRYAGANTTCATTQCCPMPFADADHDGDVDQADFGAWQVCYTGTSGGVPNGCACFDRDNDNDVDGDDFQAFGRCWTGPNVPWTQALTPTCVP